MIYSDIDQILKTHNNNNFEVFLAHINNQNLNQDLKVRDKLVLILCRNHKDLYKSLIIDYLPSEFTKNIGQNLDKIRHVLKIDYGFLFYRLWHMFYVLLMIVYNKSVNYDSSLLTINDIKYIFDFWFDYNFDPNSGSNLNSNSNLKSQIKKVFETSFDHLYKVMFIDQNVYFHAYYNNLIKHFLPLPYEINRFGLVCVYRSGVDSFYKKNDIDYLEKIESIDTVQRPHYVQKKNINKIKNEIDIHIPIKYFDPYLFVTNNYLYLVAEKENEKDNSKYNLYIVRKINIIDDGVKKAKLSKLLYKRVFDGYSQNARKYYMSGLAFETVYNEWVQYSDPYLESIEINYDSIVYLAVLKKITTLDLYNVFNKIEFSTNTYKYLFHNCGLDVNVKTQEYLEELLHDPTFFSLTPFPRCSYFTDRKCIIYKIDEKLYNLLDLTQSIATINPFTKYDQLLKLHNSANKFVYYEWSKIFDVFTNTHIQKSHNENNACLTLNNTPTNQFLNERPYCDLNNKLFYTGRRRLQEILYKTRKYDASQIWIYDHHLDIYKKNNYKINTKELYNNNYHYPEKSKVKIIVANYDTLILKDLGVIGFFSTDYDQSLRTGGEILLTTPIEFIHLIKYSNKPCYFPHANIEFIDFFEKQSNGSYILNYKKDEDEGEKETKKTIDVIAVVDTILDKKEDDKKYAYVCLLMQNSPYFLGALVMGFSLINSKTKYDCILMVTPDVPNIQKKLLSEYFIIKEIDYVEIDPALVKNYDTNRFKDVFTKFQVFEFDIYDKIIMLDIDMLVLKNMDSLFELTAPAASIRNHEIKHKKHIPTELIVKDSKLIGGINAGLMLLKPSKLEYESIMTDIKNANMRSYKNPEQDYLSLYYAKNWTQIDFKYNFQFGLLNRSNKYKLADVYNIHYSSRLKPWKLVYDYDTTINWIKEVGYDMQYYTIWFEYYQKLKAEIMSEYEVDIDNVYEIPKRMTEPN